MRTVLVVALAIGVQSVPARQTFFQSPYSLDQMQGKQAVVETTAGTVVIRLLPEVAPNRRPLHQARAHSEAGRPAL